jgi:hypothetical protein
MLVEIVLQVEIVLRVLTTWRNEKLTIIERRSLNKKVCGTPEPEVGNVDARWLT